MSKNAKEKKAKKSVTNDKKEPSTAEIQEAKLAAQKLFSKLNKDK